LQILAAHRYGIKRVILPERNVKDLAEVPSSVLANLEVALFPFYSSLFAQFCSRFRSAQFVLRRIFSFKILSLFYLPSLITVNTFLKTPWSAYFCAPHSCCVCNTGSNTRSSFLFYYCEQILLAKRMEEVLEHAFDGGCPWRQRSKL